MTTSATMSMPSATMTTGPSGDMATSNNTTVSVDDTATADSTSEPTGPATDSMTGSTTEPTTGSSGNSSGVPDDCGNGMIDAGEDCDAGDVGGTTCGDLGYDEGVIGCGNTCAFDLSGCFNIESLQNDNGNCDAAELGCSMGGMSGNPQDMLECYETSLVPPIDVVEVVYSISDGAPVPGAADLVVHEWAGPGNAPGAQVGALALDPVIDLVVGLHTFTLPASINVTTAGFCVGLHGEDPADGFRMSFTDVDAGGESWFRASTCGLPDFTEVAELMLAGDFCIRPTVTSPNL